MLLSSWLTTVLSRVLTDRPTDRKGRRFRGKLSQASDMAVLNERLEDRTLLTTGITVGGTSTYVEGAAAVLVAPGLTLSHPSDSDLTGATVALTTNFRSDQDRLQFTRHPAIIGNYSAETGVLTLSGKAPAATYEAVLRTVTYSNNSHAPSTAKRSVQFTIGSALYNPENKHFYKFEKAEGITWTDARNKAASKTLYGMQGYLATVTSGSEDDFISEKLKGEGWMGASDADKEGAWKWVTGPEAVAGPEATHLQFWSGGAGGAPVNGSYSNWEAGEPNNKTIKGLEENYAHFRANGQWNDYDNNYTGNKGYVVEYGGMEGDEVDPDLILVGNASVNVVAVNDAPVLAVSNGPPLTPQTEDIFPKTGTSVASLAAAATDKDANAQQGIAIHLTSDVKSGSWQYTQDGGKKWFNFASLGFARERSKVFLMPANGTQSQVRFYPTADFSGTVQLGYYAWDQTQGRAYDNFNLSTNDKLGGTTAFSATPSISQLTVSPVNDAPKWSVNVLPALKVQTEDMDIEENSGTPVSSLASTTTVSDVDANQLGIAIFSAPTDKGSWEYKSARSVTWTTLTGTTSRRNAMLLPADSRIRFNPNPNFNGTVQLGYYAWDRTQGTPFGRFDISTDNKVGGSTAFSTSKRSSLLTVSAVNDAPQWSVNVPPALRVETPVSSLASTTTVSDVDSRAERGIAIVSAPTDNGSWEFKLAGSATWTKLTGTTSRSNAMLLPAGSVIRFKPTKANFKGQVQLGYYAWDRTKGTPGGRFDISTDIKVGGSTPFSSNSLVSTLKVSAVSG